jgi:hypothetical protein
MRLLGFTSVGDDLVNETSIEAAEQIMLDLPARAKAWSFLV